MLTRIILAAGSVAGIALAYWEAQPKFDDTGVLVFAIFTIAALLAFLAGKRPWLLALVVGLWIPLRGIIFAHQFASLVALAVAFAGAYAGWALRKGLKALGQSGA